MTDQQKLDAANAKYDAAVENPSVSIFPGAGNVAIAKIELEALLWRDRDKLVYRGHCDER